MNELMVKENIKIEDMIFEVRGKQVILASDVGKLYGEETWRINEVVKRNINRFPEDFCFRLTEDEYEALRSQIATSSLESEKAGENLRSQFAISSLDKKNTYGGIRYLPYVFTEHGVMMLSGLLKSEIAARVNVSIINAFVKMKKYISNNLLTLNNHSNMLIDHEERIKVLENTFSKFDTFSNELFFEGQIYDAHSLLLDIFNISKESIVIIDNYISKELLDVLSKTNKQVTIHTKNIDNNLINKYQSQYNNITIIINKSFHDRFIIIDNTILYHCGASFKDLGKKCFCISKINNIEMIRNINKRL